MINPFPQSRLVRFLCVCLCAFPLPTLLLLYPAFGQAAAPPMHVVFINPATPTNAFWEKMTNGMRAAAEDFGIHLSVVYMDHEEITSRFAYVDAARSLSQAVVKPDYVIFINLRETGVRMLRLLEDAQIPSLIINSDIHPEDQPLVGHPRETFKYWLGHLSPDDESAGYLLGKQLLETARMERGKSAFDAPLDVIGIGGAVNGTAAEKRDRGLQRALQEGGGNLVYRVNTRTWTSEDSYLRVQSLLHRYPEVRIYWAASDGLAFGVRRAATEAGRGDILTGGIDWTDDGLEAIHDGRLQASVGGHVLEGILALVLLYDYHQGQDFAHELGTEIATRMQVADRHNLTLLQQRLSDASLRADNFRRLSRVANKKRQQYDLSIDSLLQLPAAAPNQVSRRQGPTR